MVRSHGKHTNHTVLLLLMVAQPSQRSLIVCGCLESLQATGRIFAGRDDRRIDQSFIGRRIVTLCVYAGSAGCISPEGKGCY